MSFVTDVRFSPARFSHFVCSCLYGTDWVPDHQAVCAKKARCCQLCEGKKRFSEAIEGRWQTVGTETGRYRVLCVFLVRINVFWVRRSVTNHTEMAECHINQWLVCIDYLQPFQGRRRF